MENLLIQQDPHDFIEVEVSEDGSATVRVGDFGGSIECPSQEASIYLSPEEAARVSKALAPG